MPAKSLAALRGRIGAYRQHALHDPRQTTVEARRAFDARFYEGLPAGLSPEESERRASARRSEFFTRLAYASAKARASKGAGRGTKGVTR